MGSIVRSKKMTISEPSRRTPAAMAATQGPHVSQCPGPWLATSPRARGEVTRVADVMHALISDSIFKQPDRHCERSEAIHSSFTRRDGLLRFARNDGKHTFATSPRKAPEPLMNLPPKEGVGNAGCPLHPRPRVHLYW